MIILPAVAFAQNNMRKSMFFFILCVFILSVCVCKCVCFSFSNQAIIVLRHFKLLRSSIMANFQNPNAVCPTKKWVGILSLFINITIIETNEEIKKNRHRLECITWRNLWLHTPIKAINVYTDIQCHSVVNTSHNHKNIENESRQHNFGHTNISTHYTRAAGYLFAFYYLNLSVFFEIFSGLFFLRRDFHHFFVFVFLYNLVFITFALATFNKRT